MHASNGPVSELVIRQMGPGTVFQTASPSVIGDVRKPAIGQPCMPRNLTAQLHTPVGASAMPYTGYDGVPGAKPRCCSSRPDIATMGNPARLSGPSQREPVWPS